MGKEPIKISTLTKERSFEIGRNAFIQLCRGYGGCFFYQYEKNKYTIKPVKKYLKNILIFIGKKNFKEIMV